jgi:predicted DNA-binding transcriptional regulator YafY
MAKSTHKIGTKLRVLSIQRDILDSKYGITRKELVEKYNVNYSTIKRDFEILETAGFILKKDIRHRYKFKRDNEFKQLKDLLHFSKEDQILLHQAIDIISPHSTRAKILKKKLASLYDFRKLGISYLNNPYLQKINTLHKAIEAKNQIILKDYQSSNSNQIDDRCVEPFHINTTEDILHAYDIDKKQLRNFKISRITHIRQTPNKWQYEGFHNILHSDPFRISSNNLVNVHLLVTLGGKNELEERYPLTKAYIEESEEEGIYEFQCKVNNQFLGLDNFILGFHREIIEIISPDIIIEHLKKGIEKIKNIEGFY